MWKLRYFLQRSFKKAELFKEKDKSVNERKRNSLVQWFKGIVKRNEPCKYDIRLVSRILWHKRIIPSLKEWRLWYLILMCDSLQTHHVYSTLKRRGRSFPSCFNVEYTWCVCSVSTAPFQWRLLTFIGKNLWRRVLEANKKQVPLKSYSLKIRIDSVDQILKNKEKII